MAQRAVGDVSIEAVRAAMNGVDTDVERVVELDAKRRLAAEAGAAIVEAVNNFSP